MHTIDTPALHPAGRRCSCSPTSPTSPRGAPSWRRFGTPTPEGFLPAAEVDDDPACRGLDPAGGRERFPRPYAGPALFFVADTVALASPGHPILVVPLPSPIRDDRRREPFRVLAAGLWSVENNLSEANTDRHEFADAADDDGVYRGSPG